VGRSSGGVEVLLAVDFEQGVSDAWSRVALFVPKFVGFLVILIIGYFVAKAIGKIVDKVLERVGFDKAVERGGIKRALERSKYDASSILGKIVFYALFLVVLQMAFGVFGTNPVSDLLASVVAYLPKVVAAILIIVIASAIGAAVREVVRASLGGLSYGKALASATGAAILIVGVFAALDQLQIAPAIVTGLFYALLAIVAGSAIIAIGGGGVQPMRARWQSMLDQYDAEKPKVRSELQGAKGRVEERAKDVAAQARSTELAPPIVK
jgi:Conserved TM helix